jgi:hypothetical protein
VAVTLPKFTEFVKSTLLKLKLFLLALSLFFRWVNSGGVEAFSTDLMMTFFPHQVFSLSWQLLWICFASVIGSLVLGLVSDLFVTSVREIRLVVIR